MRGRVVLLLLGLSSGFGLPAIADVNHALGLSVVQVIAYPASGKVLFGSGVVVGADRVATNCHVTRYARAIVVSKGALRHAVASQQADPARDLCLLETPGMQIPAAHLGAAANLVVGEPLYLYGYPRALGIAFSKGRVEALHPYEGSLIIETSADFTLGASGGGMFDDKGQLVGLATFLTAGHAGHYYAIPVDWISALTKASARKIEPLGGVSFWENTPSLPAFLKAPGR